MSRPPSPTDDLSDTLGGLFPEEARPPSPEPTFATYTREADEPGWTEIRVRLVGTHPLWGHHLWNAARAAATFLDGAPTLYRGRRVLELGAGAGLPGLVCALNGAAQVVLTDYPDPDLVANLQHNVAANVPADAAPRVSVAGYVWGRALPPGQDVFDLLILSDLVFNHSEHEALLDTCAAAAAPGATALVFYTHHRPHLAARDLAFFDRARARGWACEEVLTRRFTPMFADDPGAEEVRATVHGWRMTR